MHVRCTISTIARTNFDLLISWLAKGKFVKKKYWSLNKSVKQKIPIRFSYYKCKIVA